MDSTPAVVLQSPSRQADLACLVCRSRKVRCDRTLPDCRNCIRLGVACPRYERGSELISRKDIQRSAEDIFKAAGVEKRRVGSCEACRASKHRCSRTRPSCRRCIVRNVTCVYPTKPEREPTQEDRSYPSQAVPPVKQASPETVLPEIEIERLNLDDLPQDKELQSLLIENFFRRSHPLRCLSFLHEQSFRNSFENNCVVEDYGEALLYAMCALGLRHVYYDYTSSLENKSPPQRIPGQQLAEKARALVFANIHSPSIHDLMAMVLLCDFGIRADQNPMVFVLVAFLYRVIRLLELDHRPPLENPFDPQQVGQRETENRLVWACYFIDLFLTTGVSENSCWKDYTPGIPLPCLEQNFVAKVPSPQQFLPDVEANLTPDAVKRMDISALSILVIRLRARVLKLIRTTPPAVRLWSKESEFVQIIDRLDVIRQNLAPEYCVADIDKDDSQKIHSLGGLLFFHFLIHAVVFDLTRISLPGYNFPLAAAFHHAPQQFVRQCQDRCRFHAVHISNLIRKGLEFGRAVFADVFCADAALESAKIQIIYAATVNHTPHIYTATQENINLHLTFFKVFNRGRNGPSQWARTLLPLCVMFGFPDIADRHRELQEELNGAIEVTGPANHDHLSPFNPFRKAKTQVKQASTWGSSPKRASQASTIPSPSTHGSQRSSSTKPQVEDGSTASLPCLLPTDIFGMGFTGMEGMEGMEGMGQEDPNQQMTLPNFGMQYATTTQPSTVDYIRAADQMSGYLTWQMMELPNDLPPWTSEADFLPFI
ncbi:hypothetical protein B0I35DRAFT_474073 [Stachybotrys elegans]|uniref:Zn(2)-C6 fungal-type domain-containing protein n=1 Tax=Stachybotrys elegans TaxID=80388 RepID=A0A8K0T3G2_9HYPO|nr:hypothetical protein B0I35DRAFT_474073 [Stachybotrys elegans]